jgi:hypothetical protein
MPEDIAAQIADAAIRADALAEQLRSSPGSYAPVYATLDAAIAEIERAGARPMDVLPAVSDPGVAFSLRDKRDGRTYWDVVMATARTSICDPAGPVRTLLTKPGAGGQVTTGSLVTAIIAALGLPVWAFTIAVAIAAVILAVGVKAFCEYTSHPVDEPATA